MKIHHTPCKTATIIVNLKMVLRICEKKNKTRGNQKPLVSWEL